MSSCSIIGDDTFDPLPEVIAARRLQCKGTFIPSQVMSKLWGEYPSPNNLSPNASIVILPESSVTRMVAKWFRT